MNKIVYKCLLKRHHQNQLLLSDYEVQFLGRNEGRNLDRRIPNFCHVRRNAGRFYSGFVMRL